MKRLHSIALSALIAPAITFAASSVLAQQSTSQNGQEKNPEMQQSRDSGQYMKDKKSYNKSGSKTAAERQSSRDDSRMRKNGYINSTPDQGIHASKLMGTSVSTSDKEDVGTVSDLIIDRNGQIVAIVVGVGGVLGMGEKDIAIAWDDVTRSGHYGMPGRKKDADDSDDKELRVTATREDLRSAPEFKGQD